MWTHAMPQFISIVMWCMMSYVDDVCDFELRKHDTYDHKSNSKDFLVQYS